MNNITCYLFHTIMAGCQLAVTCDLVFASNKSKFTAPGVNIGLFCSTPGIALSRNLQPKVVYINS